MIAARPATHQVAALAVAAALWIPTPSKADGLFAFEPSGCGSISTHNMTAKWVWITVYDAGKLRHLDWGYMAPFGSRKWTTGSYSCAGIYHVRAEVKASEERTHDPGNPGNIKDTVMQVSGNNHNVYVKTGVRVQVTDAPPDRWTYANDNFWLETNDNVPGGGTQVTTPRLRVVNNAPVQLRVQAGNEASQCIDTAQAATFALPAAGRHTIKYWPSERCVQMPLAAEYTIDLPWGPSNVSYQGGLALASTTPSPKPRLTFVNQATHPVVMQVEGAAVAAPCVPPGGTAGVDIAEGVRRISAIAKSSCASALGSSFAPVVATTGNYNLQYVFKASLARQ